MKIAIYTIARNEEKHVEQFMKTCRGADYIVVGDSGSTDRTREAIQDLGGTIIPLSIVPWRFDMGRNTVLSVLPADIDFCFAMDLDEVFQSPDWRSILENAWRVGEHTRLRFRYIHSFRSPGVPGTVGMKDFAHERHNYFWQHMIHESLYYRGPAKEHMLTLPELVVEHHQDKQKSRDTYLPMLEAECRSMTATPRHIFWLIREYIPIQKWQSIVEWTDRFFEYKQIWHVEEANAWRYRAKALANLKQPEAALLAHLKSIEIAPKEREVWMDLGWYYQSRGDWVQAYGVVSQALSLTQRPEHYLAAEEAWGFKIHELASACAAQIGLVDKAREHITTAMKLGPNIPHLKRLAAKLGLSVD